MSSSLAARSQPIALELHGLLRDLDPARFRGEVEAAVRRRIAEMVEIIRAAVAERRATDGSVVLSPGRGNSGEDELSSALEDLASLLGAASARSKDEWAQYRKQLGAAYESLRQRLKAESITVPGLRPTNYTRSIVHALSGAICIALVESLLSPRARAIVPAAFAGSFWFLETLRRVSPAANRFMMWIFRHIAHPREAHHVNSSTWMATALAVLGIFYPQAMCALGIAVIAFADPAASTVGRRFGRHKLYGERTLEGTATFFAVATVVGFAVLRIWHASHYSLGRALLVAAGAGLASAAAELYSKRVDDNFSVPVVAGGVGWLLSMLTALT